MSLAVFGLLLLGALVAACWKDARATFVAVVAAMLGLTVAGSDGALGGVSQSLVDGVRAGLDGLGSSLFGA